MEISNKARPIEAVIADPRTKPYIRELLSEVKAIKEFGEKNGLESTSNYEEYVDLKRSAASYVVSACKELEFSPREWSFPIVGSFTYVGWFNEQDAKDYADEVRKEGGWDVDVRKASAYSTLGWFRDPILSTMLPRRTPADATEDWGTGYLVNVVLHESVHATHYINGQSTYNENVAVFVADQLTPLYLRKRWGKNSPRLQAYLGRRKRGAERRKRFYNAYQSLDEVYKSSLVEGVKRTRKAKILAELRKDLKIQREINNATLIQYRTYRANVSEFESFFDACGRDWNRFWSTLKEVDEDTFPKPQMDDVSGVLEKLGEQC